jgi:hypothetical protein
MRKVRMLALAATLASGLAAARQEDFSGAQDACAASEGEPARAVDELTGAKSGELRKHN